MESLAIMGKGNLEIEIFYAFTIILCSLMIYFGTKELYSLSNHKGLKYFRLSFLFFALAYFFRSFIKLSLITLNQMPMEFRINLEQLTFMLFIYFSSMAIFYLLYSIIHKRLSKKPKTILIFHALAILIAIITITIRSPTLHLIINIALLAFVILTFYLSKRQKTKKQKNNLHIIYTLMTIFWTINVLDILIPNFFKTIQLIIYLASLSIFLTMLYKVLKKVGPS